MCVCVSASERVCLCLCEFERERAFMCDVNSEMRKAIHPFVCLFAIADDLLIHISQDYVI